MLLYATNSGKSEQNARFFGITLHLHGNSKAFYFSDVSNAFRDQLKLAARVTGVACVYYTIETNHVHILVMAPDAASMQKFVRILKGSFSITCRKIKNNQDQPFFPEGTRVFDVHSMVTPVYNMEQFLTLVSYIYHNSDTMREKAVGDSKEYWKSSAAEYEKGLLTPENDILLAVLDMTWKELHEVFDLDGRKRTEWIYKWANNYDLKKSTRVLKINPDQPFSDDIWVVKTKEDYLRIISGK